MNPIVNEAGLVEVVPRPILFEVTSAKKSTEWLICFILTSTIAPSPLPPLIVTVGVSS